MKFIPPLACATMLALAGPMAWAEDVHHPEAGAAAVTAPKAATPGTAAKEVMNNMDQHTKAMHEMHEKMMNAKTPEERSALMADHRKTMQGAMAMMEGMKGDMPWDMSTRQQMLEKRMEMMEALMQMMMDRLSSGSVK